MKKGITPVVAMILLILIVVALGGVFAAWTTRTWQGVQEKGSEQISQISEQLQKSVTIDNINCDENIIYVKNTGSANVSLSEIGIYVGDTLLNNSQITATPTTIQSNQIMTINTTGVTDLSDNTVKISIGAGIQDSSDKCV